MIRYLDRGGLAVNINVREYEMTDLVDYTAEHDGYFSISGLINGQKLRVHANAPRKYFPDEDFGEWANEIEEIEIKGPEQVHPDDLAEVWAWLNDHIEFLVNGEEPDFNNGD